MAPKFEQSALRTGSGPNSPSRLAPDPDLIKRVDPNEVRVGRQKNQNKYAPIGAYLELQSIYQFLGMEAKNFKFGMFCQQCDADIWPRNASPIHTCHLFMS